MKQDTAAKSRALLYGKGIFTTVRVADGAPFVWDKHWRRLTDNAARVGLDLAGHTEDATRCAVEHAIAESNIVDGRARVTFSDDSASEIWSNDAEEKTTLSIIVGGRRGVVQPIRLTVSPYTINSRSPLAGVKSCNYLENLLTLDDALGRGFDEGIRLNERGFITSASMANLFWLKDEKLYTPSLRTGCLAGTTRELVLENIECEEVEAAIDESEHADAVFLTSAGLGIVQVSELDGRKFSPSGHPIMRLLEHV